MVDWCTGGGAASKIVVSTLLVKFELIQKHNKPFVYTLTAHFSSSAASFMCRRTISFLLCVVVAAFLLLLRCVFYQQWWWWSSSSVLSLCVRCVYVCYYYSLCFFVSRDVSLSRISLSLVLSSFASLFFLFSFCMSNSFASFERVASLRHFVRVCTRFSSLPFRYARATALTHYCGRCGIVRIVRVRRA